MKKRKREKINQRKEEKRKEWEQVNFMQKMEKTANLINGHFGDEAFELVNVEDPSIVDIDKTILNLSCDKCYHYEDVCKGRRFKGSEVMECLRKPEHEYCDVGCFDGVDEYEEDDKEEI